MAQAGSYAIRGLLGVIAIVLVGVILAQSTTAESSLQSVGSTIDASAFLSGQRLRNVSTAFDGGEVTAFMGGLNLDLRDAVMEGDEAVIDLTVLMGGVQMFLPEDWTVVAEFDTLMGGVDDKTRPRSDDEGERKRLILRGVVLMGGLDIRN